MEAVPLIFSCDTEDYETPASDDAELLWARMFARHGVRACFCVVGEEARALRARGRRDVLDALAAHEIASHSDMHSAHPTPAEYLEELSWNEGVRRFVAEESRCAQDLAEILGQSPSAWCKPGNSWGPAVPYAASLAGIPVFCDAPLEWAPGRPMWLAAGALGGTPPGVGAESTGGLLLKYHTSFDRYFRTPDGERQAQMRADFEALLAARLAEAARDGESPGTIVMYTHPSRTVTAAFPSNFTAGKNPPRDQWQPAPLRPQSETEALVRDFDAFLAWIGELRAAGGVALTTYRELFARYRQPASATAQRQHVLELARALAVDGSSIEARQIGGMWLSPAEQFGVVCWALAHAAVWGQVPRDVPVRRLLGPIEDEPPAAVATAIGTATKARLPRTVTPRDVQILAASAEARCAASGAVPRSLALDANGTTMAAIGPGRALRLLARGLVALTAHGGAGAALRVPDGGDDAALASRDDVARLHFKETWSIFPPDFEGRRLLEQTRWQTWSAKPA
jgi:peptidoglycan/xylan/chitin deacetylase (PgdA/CDA1 family)